MQHRLRDLFISAGFALALVPMLTACPKETEDEGNEDVGETGETDESDESETSQNAGEGETSETDTEDAEESDTNEGNESAETGGPEPDPEALQACIDSCAVFEQCGEPLPECSEDCAEMLAGLDEECVATSTEFFSCIAALTCEEFEHYMEGEPEPYPCQGLEDGIDECLSGNVCIASAGQGENPDECEIYSQCPDEPEYGASCNADGCVCLEDGVEVGGCSPAALVCEELDSAALVECCGFPI